MKPVLATVACLLAGSITGCGGGGGSSDDGTLPAPPVGQKVDFAVIDTDNSNNTIPWTLEVTVQSSSPIRSAATTATSTR